MLTMWQLITAVLMINTSTVASLRLMPKDPVVEAGSSLTLTCYLEDPNLQPKNIYFSYSFHNIYKNFSQENVAVLDNSTVQLHVKDVRKGTYYCDHNPSTGYEAQYVEVGCEYAFYHCPCSVTCNSSLGSTCTHCMPLSCIYYKIIMSDCNKKLICHMAFFFKDPPDKATISCISYNFEELTCSWTTGRDPLISTNWTALKSNDNVSYTPCDRQGQKCTLDSKYITGISQYFKVQGKNVLGESTSAITEVDIFKSVKLNPVRNVKAIAVNNSMISLSWQASPSGRNIMEDYILSTVGRGLQYRVEYRIEPDNHTVVVYLNRSKTMNATIYLTNVAPATNQYNISIAVRPQGGLYWSSLTVVTCGNLSETTISDSKSSWTPLPQNMSVLLIGFILPIIIVAAIVIACLGLWLKRKIYGTLDIEVPDIPHEPDITTDSHLAYDYNMKYDSYTRVSNADSGLVHDSSLYDENISHDENDLSSALDTCTAIRQRDIRTPLLYEITNTKLPQDRGVIEIEKKGICIADQSGCQSCGRKNSLSHLDIKQESSSDPTQNKVWKDKCRDISGLKSKASQIDPCITCHNSLCLKLNNTPQGYSRFDIQYDPQGGVPDSSDRSSSLPSSGDMSDTEPVSPDSGYISFTKSENTHALTTSGPLREMIVGDKQESMWESPPSLLNSSSKFFGRMDRSTSEVTISEQEAYTKKPSNKHWFSMCEINKNGTQDLQFGNDEDETRFKNGYVSWTCL
ncbi:uncharacterized protein LOC106155932 isoform X1 [Lingula anatina]|uniref:Uncharacterized protein LOC106155932 isoform X1 n=1 Tax=Lingula anatina TaxID=7574 RepID=A0A1S3HLV7_LINAN|nr:uncharacterized protein LOC106155932 isoform X1 [Lingula anatina]XP_013386438.1 uncharacterized protein LOC106155932 isoform X1 [Lingula anatina]XP_013386443.1 uncharacterized protein LOC106155932 isoform X1 [Lingula anatina]XP_013386452.1 uncharacterized protein LOC106155932 isoform X1 [Lingula anatina]XP_013386466.1 uncharacterized protein LOC106155932 isoform X1 [Lingula anatina]|eukprot:XP_013386431.1 uncharacterized protein LOC106155932 isoform X1 [Lingula anatina]